MVIRRASRSMRPIVGPGGVLGALVGWGLMSGDVLSGRGFFDARYSQRALASPMTSAVLHSAEIGGSSNLCVRNSLFVDLLLIRLSLRKIHGDGWEFTGMDSQMGVFFLFLFGGGR